MNPELPSTILFTNSDGEPVGIADGHEAAAWGVALAWRLASLRNNREAVMELILQSKADTGNSWEFICQMALQYMAIGVMEAAIGHFDAPFVKAVDDALEGAARLTEQQLADYQASKNAPDHIDA
jgi:hypothetical protein